MEGGREGVEGGREEKSQSSGGEKKLPESFRGLLKSNPNWALLFVLFVLLLIFVLSTLLKLLLLLLFEVLMLFVLLLLLLSKKFMFENELSNTNPVSVFAEGAEEGGAGEGETRGRGGLTREEMGEG